MGPGVRNLLTIFQAFTGWSDDNTRAHFTGMRYGDLKKQVAEAVVSALEPIQKRYQEIMAEPGFVAKVLANGAERVTPIAQDTVNKVKRHGAVYGRDYCTSLSAEGRSESPVRWLMESTESVKLGT